MHLLRRKSVMITIIILLIITLFIGYSWKKTDDVSYQTVTVTRGDLDKNVLAIGKLDAVSKVDVGAQVSGQLQTLYVKEGDMVKKGDLLAVIDPQKAKNDVIEEQQSIYELEANLAQARAELKLAEVTHQRQLALAKTYAISQQELDQAKTDVEVKRSRVTTYNAQIKRSQARLNTAKTNLNYTQITAPISGIVTHIKTLQGQTVIAAQEAPTILTLADLDTMLVKAEVSEADIIDLKPGLKASFTVLGAPEQAFNGVLKDILPTPEKINDAIFYYARFQVPNPQHVLKLQMTAQVIIALASHKNVLLLPLTALGSEISPMLYEVDVLNKEKEEKRQVKIGSRNEINVQIISGLHEGDKVIIGRQASGEH